MGIRLDSSVEEFVRTTNLVSRASCTMCGWFKISSDTNNYQTFFHLNDGNDGLFQHYFAGTGPDGTTLVLYSESDSGNGTNLTVGTFYHIAFVGNNTGAGALTLYLNGVLDITHDTLFNFTSGKLRVGNSRAGGEQFNGVVAAVKLYDAVLTPAEIQMEMRQYLPVRTANLNGFYPFFSTNDDDVDFSGNSNNWTVNGTLSTEDGPPIPWSCSSDETLILSGDVPPPLPTIKFIKVNSRSVKAFNQVLKARY